MIIFEWNQNKCKQNIKKHGIDFEETVSVFYDEDAILIPDQLHSKQEEKFLLLGESSNLNILVISHCYRENENVIRIISARKATKNEISQYGQRKGQA